MTSTKREPIFDLIKAFAIYLVILGHTIQHYCPIPTQDIVLYKFIYLFHMPLFMIISGYFSSSSFKLDIGSFFKKKSKTLLIPVFTFSLIMTLWFAFIEYRLKMNLEDYIIAYWKSLNTWLWFLRSLFLCYTITYIISKVFHNNKTKWYFLSFIAICIFPITYCNLGQMFPCFILGILFKENNITNRLNTNNHKYLILGLSSVILTLTILNISIYPPLLLKFVKLITGICISMFIIISLYSYKNSNIIQKLSGISGYIGIRTLEIYVLQCFIVEIFTPIILKVPYFNFISEIVIYPLMAIIFLIVILLIEKITTYSHITHKLLFGK